MTEAQALSFNHDGPQFEQILGAIKEAVWVIDDFKRITYTNKQAESLSGYTAVEALSNQYASIVKIKAGFNLNTWDILRLVLKTGGSRDFPLDTYLIHKNGQQIPISGSCIPLKDPCNNEQINGCVFVMQDIRERVAEAQSKDDFLSVVTHQLRTPLGSMRWNMEMLMAGDFGPIPDSLRPTLSQMQEINGRMTNLVNSLLNISRIDQKRVKEEFSSVQIIDVINDVMAEMMIWAKARSVALNLVVIHEPVPEIMIDPKRFHEIIENLINNAIKYCRPKGSVDVIVEPGDKYIEIAIKDTGIGIAHQEQGMIFSKFFRANNAIRSESEGSGLGLFVVKSYIEAWGGSVKFESEEGAGTTFFLKIPLQPRQHVLDRNLESVNST